MEQISRMFSDLTFYNVGVKNGYLMYAAQIYSLTNDEKYVILIVPNTESQNMKTAKIYHLKWISLQTRILTDVYYNIPTQDLNPKMLDSRLNDKVDLRVVSREASMTNYTCPTLDIEVSLLLDRKKKTINQYPDHMDLSHALKSFQCIVRLSEKNTLS